MSSRCVLLIASLCAVVPASASHAQGFFSNLAQRAQQTRQTWNDPQWNAPAPGYIKTPGQLAGGDYPTSPEQLYQGANAANMPMPQLVNTWDRWKATAHPPLISSVNYLKQHPQGLPLARSLVNNFGNPKFGTHDAGLFKGSHKYPSNVAGVMFSNQFDRNGRKDRATGQYPTNYGMQFADQANQIAAANNTQIQPAYQPNKVGQGVLDDIRPKATQAVFGNLKDLGREAAGYAPYALGTGLGHMNNAVSRLPGQAVSAGMDFFRGNGGGNAPVPNPGGAQMADAVGQAPAGDMSQPAPVPGGMPQ